MKRKTCKACSARLPEGLKPWVTWCSEDCGTKLAMKNLERDARNKERALGRERREFKAKVRGKDYGYQFQLTKKAAQSLAVALDNGRGCISCGTVAVVQYCGGHYKTAGAHPELALDLRNIHLQCNRYCNCGLSGNIAGNKNTRGFRAGLVGIYGDSFVAWLDEFHEPKRYSCSDLKTMRAEFAAETRRLKKGLPPSRNWRELPPLESGQKA